jgi:hypothetical protein
MRARYPPLGILAGVSHTVRNSGGNDKRIPAVAYIKISYVEGGGT